MPQRKRLLTVKAEKNLEKALQKTKIPPPTPAPVPEKVEFRVFPWLLKQWWFYLLILCLLSSIIFGVINSADDETLTTTSSSQGYESSGQTTTANISGTESTTGVGVINAVDLFSEEGFMGLNWTTIVIAVTGFLILKTFFGRRRR